jgi:hypothetical protein
MRLNEFTDPRTHTSTDIDVADCLRQIEKLWPQSIEGDGVSCLIHVKKSKAKGTKLIDVLSARRHISRK